MGPVTFPNELYVHECLTGKGRREFDAYETWDDCEEDDTLAIYQLVQVVRVKATVSKRLVEEKNHKVIVAEWTEPGE